jgi:hypothetical protein
VRFLLRNIFWILTILLLSHGCKIHHDISSIKPNHYYFTQIEENPYIILIDTVIENQKSKGIDLLSTAYLIDKNEFTKPLRFQVTYKKRKPKALLENKSVTFSNTFATYEAPSITEFPRRYLDTLFSTYIYKDVVFAQAEGYWDSNFNTEEQMGKAMLEGVMATLSKKKLNLKMDIYVPLKAGKTERPLLMMIHGGAFYVGDKSDQTISKMCTYFASLGYTTASINYRLGFQPTKASIERAGYMAAQDAHAAMRFLIANASKYKIDPNFVFVGGSSAGGITSLNLAFMQNKNRPKNTYKSLTNNDLGNIESVGKFNNTTFKIKSVANLWGAIDNLDMLKNNKVSVISYHAMRDPVVPYDYDYPMQKIVKQLTPLLFSKIYGSKPIHAELRNLRYRENLFALNKETHSLWTTHGKINDIFEQIIHDVSQFFYEDLVPNPANIEHDPDFYQRYFITNTQDIDLITWQCDGGFFIRIYKDEVFVIWRTNATDKKLTASGTYINGAAFKTEIKK